MVKKELAPKKRIPYKVWSNSHLSPAKYYGGIKINGVEYRLDYDNCETRGEGEDKKHFPDLVEQ